MAFLGGLTSYALVFHRCTTQGFQKSGSGDGPMPSSGLTARNTQDLGAWVAQLVECLTWAQVTISRFVGPSPASGSVLMTHSLEPASDSVSPSLSAPLLFALWLSQKINIKQQQQKQAAANTVLMLLRLKFYPKGHMPFSKQIMISSSKGQKLPVTFVLLSKE